MSKALAFIIGVAVIVAAILFLFTPETGQQSSAPVANQAIDTEEADSNTSTGLTNSQPGDGNSQQAASDDVSRWPDPDATTALPARPENAARDARPVVALWQPEADGQKTEVEGFPATRLKADPEALEGLHVGQQLALQVPELNRTLTARLSSTNNQLNDVQVFRGPISGGHENDNVVVTRGEKATYVVMSTRQGVYSAVIDNESGETVLTNDNDIQDNLAGEDDAIPVPEVDQEPPQQ